ncbi:MAG: Hpt domain-containing protein [Pseudomonadota bacterium]
MSEPALDDDIDGLVVIDEAHLASFTEGDLTLEDELAELFVATARGYLKRMREAVEEERSWSAEAHALKGAGANLGAKRVAALARRAEFMPPSDDQVEALNEAIDDVKAFFAKRQL